MNSISEDSQTALPDDPLGAFCQDNHKALQPTGSGALNGLSFAAKDVMDVAGSTTGFGQPSWLATHEPATASATVVDRLLSAGALLLGKTISDELSYSLTGENVHYGTPQNPCDPSRVPGGSSSGSVAAVAGGLVDFALGTDCAGSVRLPASYCGVYGMRPSHARVPTTGIQPFAPSFDTLGWLARDAHTLRLAGSVLLNAQPPAAPPQRLLIADDCFAMLAEEVRAALLPAVGHLRSAFNGATPVTLSEDLEPWMDCFRTLQGAEIWDNLGAWITATQPQFGPGIDERVADARRITPQQVATARVVREQIACHLRQLIGPGDVLCLPTSPRVAPARGTATSTVEVSYRYQAICLLSIAGLAGLPQISLPLATLGHLPLGLSIIGPVDSDRQLLDLACSIAAGTAQTTA